MAYMDFRAVDGLSDAMRPCLQGATADPVPAGPERLTALEWSVVALAERDTRASLARPSRLATALRVLFNQPNPKLADERLEALRRTAVLTWHEGYSIPSREVRTLLAAGFTPGQYELMVDSITAAKASRVGRRATAVPALA